MDIIIQHITQLVPLSPSATPKRHANDDKSKDSARCGPAMPQLGIIEDGLVACCKAKNKELQ